MATIYEQTSGNDWLNLYAGFYISDGIGYTGTAQYYINSFTCYIKKNGSPTGNVQAHIYSCTGSTTCDASPVESSSNSYAANSISTSETAYTFNFAGTTVIGQYDRIVLTVTGGDSSNNISFRSQTSAVTDWARVAYRASTGWIEQTTASMKGDVTGSEYSPVTSSGLLLPPQVAYI